MFCHIFQLKCFKRVKYCYSPKEEFWLENINVQHLDFRNIISPSRRRFVFFYITKAKKSFPYCISEMNWDESGFLRFNVNMTAMMVKTHNVTQIIPQKANIISFYLNLFKWIAFRRKVLPCFTCYNKTMYNLCSILPCFLCILFIENHVLV